MEFQKRPHPQTGLAKNDATGIGKLLAEIWYEGPKHQMTVFVSGGFAFSGITCSSALEVMSAVSIIVGGDSDRRRDDVLSVYRNYEAGKEVHGWPSLDKMIEAEFPEALKGKARRIIAAIKKMMPGPAGDDDHPYAPDFDIINIVKFESRPPQYIATIRRHGESQEYKVGKFGMAILTDARQFRKAFFEATCQFISIVKQWRWEAMVEAAPLEIVKAPVVQTLEARILEVLEDFLAQKKENPEPGELKTFPGCKGEDVFLSIRAFKNHLNDGFCKATDREIVDILCRNGWIPRRVAVGDKQLPLWIKTLRGPDQAEALSKSPKEKKPSCIAIRIRKEADGTVVAYVEKPGMEPGKGISIPPGGTWHPEPYDVDNLPGLFGIINETGTDGKS